VSGIMQQKQMQQPAKQGMKVSRVGRMLRVSAVSEKAGAGHKAEVPPGGVLLPIHAAAQLSVS
jgi:hypothetical protein